MTLTKYLQFIHNLYTLFKQVFVAFFRHLWYTIHDRSYIELLSACVVPVISRAVPCRVGTKHTPLDCRSTDCLTGKFLYLDNLAFYRKTV